MEPRNSASNVLWMTTAATLAIVRPGGSAHPPLPASHFSLFLSHGDVWSRHSGWEEEERTELDVVVMRSLRSSAEWPVWREAEMKTRGRLDLRELKWAIPCIKRFGVGFGLMEPVEEERLTSRVFKSNLKGGRNRGRLNIGWLDVVKNACKSVGEV